MYSQILHINTHIHRHTNVFAYIDKYPYIDEGQANVRTGCLFSYIWIQQLRNSHTPEHLHTHDTCIGFEFTVLQPQELIPEQMWLRLVEWPGSSIWVVYV